MLRVDKIEFWLGDYATYTIDKSQIETFPLIGGNGANTITTQVWNQHGNTYVETFMQPIDEEISFALYYGNKNRYEQLELRKAVTDICNPLNGILQMKVFLNTGDIFNRDITFRTAPSFPTGLDNRNPVWQKVVLSITAHNPFWYSEKEIVESFQAVDPLFYFPFTMASSAPVYFGNVRPNNVAINTGQVPAPVTIRITGACINPKITKIINGIEAAYIKFNNLTLAANDLLEITTAFGEKGVWLNGQSVFNKLDFSSDFFSLDVGENEIEFTDDSGSRAASIHFIYKNLYITV
jgi:Phage tail protein